ADAAVVVVGGRVDAGAAATGVARDARLPTHAGGARRRGVGAGHAGVAARLAVLRVRRAVRALAAAQRGHPGGAAGDAGVTAPERGAVRRGGAAHVAAGAAVAGLRDVRLAALVGVRRAVRPPRRARGHPAHARLARGPDHVRQHRTVVAAGATVGDRRGVA